MKKLVIYLLFSSIMIHASLLDFRTLTKAKDAYHDGNYTEAIAHYSTIKEKSDALQYDLANSYYKAKKYKEAKALYETIKDKEFRFAKWHNIGNCEANLGNLDAGIKAYEKALTIKKDKDTAYNLELLKKKKKEKEQKKQNKKKNKKQDKKDSKEKNKNDNKKQNNKDKKKDSDKKNKQKGDSKKQDKKEQSQKQKEAEKKQSKQSQPKKETPKKENKKAKPEKKKAQQAMQNPTKKSPISDKEVAKYLKMLDKRGVNTLLVPLNQKGDRHEETTPW